MSRITVSVNGRSLQEYGSWQSLKYSHGWPYGSLRASWQMRDGIRHPGLALGALVVLYLSGIPIWRGLLLEPGRDGAMEAVGLWEEAKGAMSLTATGAATAEPRDAVVQAINRGTLRWSTPVPDIYPGAAAQQMDAPYPLQRLTELLDHVTENTGTRWAVDSFTGRLVVAADSTTPKWIVPHLVAGSGLTPASDSVATHLLGEYIDGPGSRKQTPAVASPDYTAGAPRIEAHVSLISKGFITQAQAIGYLTAMYGNGVGRAGWADGLLLSRGDVFTAGGQTVDPAAVIAGPDCVLRLDGVWDDRSTSAQTAYTSIVGALTEYDEDADTVQVTPVGKETRTLKETPLWLS